MYFSKAQATDTIVIYGMALIIISIVIGVLYGDRILTANKYIPPSCDISPRIVCTDFKINTTGHGSLQIHNKFGEDMFDVMVRVGNCDASQTLTLIQNTRSAFLNFENCGDYIQNAIYREGLSLNYKVIGSSTVFDFAGSLLTRVEDGYAYGEETTTTSSTSTTSSTTTSTSTSTTSTTTTVIIPLVAPECTYLTSAFSTSIKRAYVIGGSSSIWTKDDTFYIKKTDDTIETLDIDCIVPFFATDSIQPNCIGFSPVSSDLIVTTSFPSQSYPDGTPAGILGCCADLINPVRGNYTLLIPSLDTYLDEANPATPGDSFSTLLLEEQTTANDKVGLMQFDLSDIQSQAIIINVTLRLTKFSGDSTNLGLHKLTTPQDFWDSVFFFPTWNSRGLVSWSSGSFSSADYEIIPLASVTTPAANIAFNITGQGLIDDVQAAIDGNVRKINFTLILANDGSVVTVYSKEDTVSARRPVLQILLQSKIGDISLCPFAPVDPAEQIVDTLGVTSEFFASEERPAIYGDIIVWQNFTTDNYDIYMCDITQTGSDGGCDASDAKSQVTSNIDSQVMPDISLNKIIWIDAVTSEIYMCEIGVNCGPYDVKTQVTSGGGVKTNPKISASGSDYKIVWQQDTIGQGYHIWMCDSINNGGDGGCGVANAKTQITDDPVCSPDLCQQVNPDISGNVIVWEHARPDGIADIYRCNTLILSGAGSCTFDEGIRVTDTGVGSDTFPKVDGDDIVWFNGNFISRCSLSISSGTGACHAINLKFLVAFDGTIPRRNLDVGTNIIVWDENSVEFPPIQKHDVYLCDIALTGSSGGCDFIDSKIQITTDTAHQIAPAVYGTRVVWQDYRNGNADIYLCDAGFSSCSTFY